MPSNGNNFEPLVNKHMTIFIWQQPFKIDWQVVASDHVCEALGLGQWP